MIIAVKEAAYAVAKRKPEKISGLLGFEPSLVRYRCSAPKTWNYVVYVCKECMECLKGIENLTKQPVPFKSL